MDTFTRMELLYRGGGQVPWDRELPPPEVIALAAELPPGRALDLGCGYGRASIYLAQHGWMCDGVDFIPEAVAGARMRAATANVADRALFHTLPVTDLASLAPPYDLAVDVGCMHNLARRRSPRVRGGSGAARRRGRLVRPLRPRAEHQHGRSPERRGRSDDPRALHPGLRGGVCRARHDENAER